MTILKQIGRCVAIGSLLLIVEGFGVADAQLGVFVGPEGSSAQLYIKHDAKIDALAGEMEVVGPAVVQAFHKFGFGRAPVVTSGSEFASWRKSWSLHLKGRAIDVRGRDLPMASLKLIAEELSEVLGDQFDVVLEDYGEYNPFTHLHIEYHPKKPV